MLNLKYISIEAGAGRQLFPFSHGLWFHSILVCEGSPAACFLKAQIGQTQCLDWVCEKTVWHNIMQQWKASCHLCGIHLNKATAMPILKDIGWHTCVNPSRWGSWEPPWSLSAQLSSLFNCFPFRGELSQALVENERYREKGWHWGSAFWNNIPHSKYHLDSFLF